MNDDDKKRQLSDELQYQLDLYRASDIGGVFTVLIDAQYTLIYGNDLYFQLYEYNPEQLLNHSCISFIHPQDRKHVHNVLCNAQSHHMPTAEWEMRIITGTKKIKYVFASGHFHTRNDELIFDGHITDVTKSKAIERKLRESEEKFLIATENSDVFFWTYYFDSKEVIQSNSSRRVHGYNKIIPNVPESLIELKTVHPNSAKSFRQMYDDLANGAKTVIGEFWFKSPDNDDWWCERIRYTNVFDDCGKPIYAHAIGRDITTEKLTERKYNEELSYKNAIVATNFIGSMRANLTTGKVEEIVSPYAAFKQNYAGKSYIECIDILISFIVDDSQRKIFAPFVHPDYLIKEFKRGNLQKDFKMQRKMPDGDYYKWVQTTVKLFKKTNSDHIIAFIYSYDINREEIYKLSMAKIAQSNFDMIGCIDGVNNTYTLFSNIANAASYDASNYEQSRIKFLSDLGIGDTSLLYNTSLLAITDKLESQDIYSLEFTIKKATGDLRRKQLRFSYIDKQTKTIMFTQNDFTDVVNKENLHQKALQSALDAAESANSAKSKFLSRMSHDMRTPMNGIIGFTNLTLDMPNLADEIKQNLMAINESGKYLLSLINDTLDMSKIESDKITLNPESVNVGKLIDNIATCIMPAIKEKNIDFKILPINSQFEYIFADKIRLQQIFVNILSNAVKFTNDGGKIEFIIECLKQENDIAYDKIIIRDNGIGMHEEFLSRIFDPFEQEQNTFSSNYTGTGLGMPIVKNLVEKMGGTIHVKSKKNIGTEVIVNICFKRINNKTANETALQISDVNLNKRQILLCEDHPINMQIARKLLEKKGIFVTEAKNGQEAVEKFTNSETDFFDAILMDIRMPVMDGLEATKAIRAGFKTDAKIIPIIAMTANAYDDDREKSRKAGMNAHLAKPIEPQLLYEKLYECICKREKTADNAIKQR